MKKGTKVGLTLIGLAGLAAAAAVAVKKYQEKYYDEDLIDDAAEFLQEHDEPAADSEDDGKDKDLVEEQEKIVKPAVKIPAKEQSAKKKAVKKTTSTTKPKTVKAKTVKNLAN